MFNAATNDSSKGKIIHALSTVLAMATTEIRNSAWPAEAQRAAENLVAATSAASVAASSLLADLTNEAATRFAFEVEAMTHASSKMRAVLDLPTPGMSPGRARSVEYPGVPAHGFASTSP